MMDKDIILSFIRETGFRTRSDVQDKFSSENLEILDMTLGSLTEKGLIKKARFSHGVDHDDIYYIPFLG